MRSRGGISIRSGKGGKGILSKGFFFRTSPGPNKALKTSKETNRTGKGREEHNSCKRPERKGGFAIPPSRQ